jgi:pectate lyase
LNVETLEPVRWTLKGEKWIPSNLARQQNLLRTLVGLSNLTGESRYHDAAAAAVKYHVEHLQAESGLFQWGGHRTIDLASGEARGEGSKMVHELKFVLPFYELFWEVDPKATEKFIKAFWNGHVLDWSNLDMTRHASYGKRDSKLWESKFDPPEPFFEGRGLTFIHTGSDLIYSAAMLYRLNNDKGAMLWARRMAEQYVRARHPKTGLGVFQYSKPLRRGKPPAEGPLTGRFTRSTFGDRAENQFGAAFGEVAKEGYLLITPEPIYGRNAIMQLRLAEMLGDEGKDFLKWTVDGLKAYARYAYDGKTNTIRMMWADGTDLSDYVVTRSGYYGSKGRTFKPRPASALFLYSYTLGFRLSGDKALWPTARDMARGFGLGDIGTAPGKAVKLDLETECSSPILLFTALELCRTSDDPAYRALAIRLGDNIIAKRLHNGLFVPGKEYLNAGFNSPEPLALLSLEAMLQGKSDAVPRWNAGDGYFHCPHDGYGRTTDARAIWSVRRENAEKKK